MTAHLRFTRSCSALLLACFFLLHAGEGQGATNFERCSSPDSLAFTAPTAVAVDGSENIYVADLVENSILIHNSSGSLQQVLSGLAVPVSVAVGSDSRIYVGNSAAERTNVEVYDQNLDLLFKLGQGDGEFTIPSAIAVSASGRIYVADGDSDVVKVYEADGSHAFSFGSSGSSDGQFNEPTSLDVTADAVYVTDLQLITVDGSSLEGARVQTFDLNGNFVSSFGTYGQGDGLLTKPLGVAVDASNTVFVADAYQNVVQAFDSDGNHLTTAYSLEQPMRTVLDVAVGSQSERLYIAAQTSGRVDLYCPVVPSHAVTVSLAGQGGFVISDNSTVTAGETYEFTVEDQQSIDFSIMADEANGYHLTSVVLDGVDILANDQLTVLATDNQDQPVAAELVLADVAEAHLIEATFELNTYTIDITSNSCGSATASEIMSPSGQISVSHGANQTVTVTYDPDQCNYSDLLVDGISQGELSSYLFEEITTSHTVEAVFTEPTYEISASVAPAEGGSISPSGTATVTQGAESSYTCTANEGYLVSLLVDDVAQEGESYTFSNISSNHTISCQFTPSTYLISAGPAVGSEGCSFSPLSAQVDPGQSQTFMVVADGSGESGEYCVEDILVDGSSVGPAFSYTFQGVDAPHTLEVSCSPCLPGLADNTPPMADAGPLQDVACGAAVLLSGENSRENDEGDAIVTYAWQQTAGTAVTLYNSDGDQAYFTAPTCQAGAWIDSLTFELTVTDSFGATDTDSTTVNPSHGNIAPQALAGADQTVYEGDTVTLDGASSVDSDGILVSYVWEQVEGITVSLDNAWAATTTFSAPALGEGVDSTSLTFRLTVMDNLGAIDQDDVTINISLLNSPPSALADCPVEVVESGALVTLSGSGSDDPDDGLAAYRWTQTATSSTDPVAFSDPATASPTFIAPEAGPDGAILTFELTVTDLAGAKSSDSCQVEVAGSGDYDSDRDGLPDTLEETGCTEVNNADTDNDGMVDGAEDLNANGLVDEGETDPCVDDSAL